MYSNVQLHLPSNLFHLQYRKMQIRSQVITVNFLLVCLSDIKCVNAFSLQSLLGLSLAGSQHLREQLGFRHGSGIKYQSCCFSAGKWMFVSQNVKLVLLIAERTQVKTLVANALLFPSEGLSNVTLSGSVWWHSIFVPESSPRLNSVETPPCSCFFSLSLWVLVLFRRTGRIQRCDGPIWQPIFVVCSETSCGTEITGKDGK